MPGAPFSAEVVSETVHWLRDGSQLIQRRAPTHVYRDSDGRVRSDGPEILDLAAFSVVHTDVYIFDPVARLAYVLDANKKVAYVRKLMPMELGPSFRSTAYYPYPPQLPPDMHNLPDSMASPDGKRLPLQPELRQTPLGMMDLEGLALEGLRNIDTAPAGWHGFRQSFDMILDSWVSKELDCLVFWKMSDPRTGEATWKLEHIDRSVPDPNLFQVPSDYITKKPNER
jgi:hypothetical protein